MKVQDKRFEKRFFFKKGNVDVNIFHYKNSCVAIVLHYDVVNNEAQRTEEFYGTRKEGIGFLKEVF